MSVFLQLIVWQCPEVPFSFLIDWFIYSFPSRLTQLCAVEEDKSLNMEAHFWPLQQFSPIHLITVNTAQRKWNQMLVWSAGWKWPGQIRKHEAAAYIHVLFVSLSAVWLVPLTLYCKYC